LFTAWYELGLQKKLSFMFEVLGHKNSHRAVMTNQTSYSQLKPCTGQIN